MKRRVMSLGYWLLVAALGYGVLHGLWMHIQWGWVASFPNVDPLRKAQLLSWSYWWLIFAGGCLVALIVALVVRRRPSRRVAVSAIGLRVDDKP
jgi:hypothetical protein